MSRFMGNDNNTIRRQIARDMCDKQEKMLARSITGNIRDRLKLPQNKEPDPPGGWKKPVYIDASGRMHREVEATNMAGPQSQMKLVVIVDYHRKVLGVYPGVSIAAATWNKPINYVSFRLTGRVKYPHSKRGSFDALYADDVEEKLGRPVRAGEILPKDVYNPPLKCGGGKPSKMTLDEYRAKIGKTYSVPVKVTHKDGTVDQYANMAIAAREYSKTAYYKPQGNMVAPLDKFMIMYRIERYEKTGRPSRNGDIWERIKEG